MNLLDLAVKITCDDQASGQVDGIGSKITGALSTAAKVGGMAVAALGTATVGMGKMALDAYSNYEQLVGGVDTLFKDSSGKLQAYAAQAYQTAGMSANQYMETATSFSASLIQGLGGDTQAAVEAANMAITDMSDNANKMGTDIDAIRDAYQGFAKGNYEMLDNLKLGYGGTAGEMARLINDTGVMGDSFKATAKNVNEVPFDKMIEAIHQAQTEMGITGTTALEASTTIEGSVNSAKAAWQNWLTGLGADDADMAALTDQLVQSVVQAGSNIVPRMGQIMSTLVQTVVQYAPQLGQEIMGGLSQIDFAQVGQTASDLILMLVNGIVTNLPMLAQAALQIVMALGQGLVTNGPQILTQLGQLLLQLAQYVIANVPSILDAAMQFFGMILQGIVTYGPQILTTLASLLGQLIGQVVSWAGQMLANAVSAAANFLGGLMGGLAALPGRVASFLGGIISGVASWVGQMASNAVSAASQFASNLISGLQSIPGRVVSIGSQIIQGMVNGVTGAAQGLIDAVGGAVGDAIDWAKGLLGIASPSKVFREIGQFTMQGAALGVDDDADLLLTSTDNAMRGMISTAQDIKYTPSVDSAETTASIIEWLDTNLGDIIASYTPYIGMRDLDRLTRKAVAHA